MKSIRDLVNRMPETKSGLEKAVREYDPEIARAIEAHPDYKHDLEYAVGETFDKYGKYLGGLTHKLSVAGHAVGYTADAWLATGDIVGSLGGKFLHLLAQIPEKAYSLIYAARTGNYIDSLQNIFEGILSYVPGFTIADQGLSRIVQKRMVKEATKKMREKIGAERLSDYETIPEGFREVYTDVKTRGDNIIRINRGEDDGNSIKKAA
ncbi:hypothetical protein J4416_04230 [Candidatus Pacearchaeota archaeon]|nr:hypothetical protein [Candidatus Pacearchaeota archaeon]